MNNTLILRPIGDLLNESFFIPAYQRGFRWTQRQVTELLDDISEFQRQSEEGPKSAFYCLQPVVVKQHADNWELVDGQQRLTTIFIILNYLKEIAILLGKGRYSIRYETRPDSTEYLEKIDEARHTSNIDFFHMYKAKQAIHEWFEQRDGTYKFKFLQTLLNNDEDGKNVKIIWYQINEDIEATEVFTRLNMGKIPLTNGELVKALFLKASNFEEGNRFLQQLKIAQEWDEIERMLQRDDFWFFISNKVVEANRIEFVLSLVANQLSFEGNRDRFFIFLSFSHWLSQHDEPIELAWDRVKRCFMILREWYEDHALFHLIGFLVSRGSAIEKIMDIFYDCPTKHFFRQVLTANIFKVTFSELQDLNEFDNQTLLKEAIEEHLEQLSYFSSSNHQLVSVLLLFNMATLLANPESNARFQFERFKNDSWDIEHICSVASNMPQSKERQKAWLEGVIQYVDKELIGENTMIAPITSKLKEVLKNGRNILNGNTFDSGAFENLFNQVYELYTPDGNEEIDHSLGNLTLLDSSTNRSYQNAIFPIKRNRIICLDKTATFVPVCTKNAFLKYYSDRVDNIMFWDARDSKNHQMAMVELLTIFFSIRENTV